MFEREYTKENVIVQLDFKFTGMKISHFDMGNPSPIHTSNDHNIINNIIMACCLHRFPWYFLAIRPNLQTL